MGKLSKGQRTASPARPISAEEKKTRFNEQVYVKKISEGSPPPLEKPASPVKSPSLQRVGSSSSVRSNSPKRTASPVRQDSFRVGPPARQNSSQSAGSPAVSRQESLSSVGSPRAAPPRPNSVALTREGSSSANIASNRHSMPARSSSPVAARAASPMRQESVKSVKANESSSASKTSSPAARARAAAAPAPTTPPAQAAPQQRMPFQGGASDPKERLWTSLEAISASLSAEDVICLSSVLNSFEIMKRDRRDSAARAQAHAVYNSVSDAICRAKTAAAATALRNDIVAAVSKAQGSSSKQENGTTTSLEKQVSDLRGQVKMLDAQLAAKASAVGGTPEKKIKAQAASPKTPKVNEEQIKKKPRAKGSLYGKASSRQNLAITAAPSKLEEHKQDNEKNVQYQEPENMQFRRLARMKVSTDFEKLSYNVLTKSQHRMVKLSDDESQIVYYATNGREKKRLNIQDIYKVAYGPLTSSFQHRRTKKMKDRRAPWLCWSLVLKDRTYDFVAIDEQTAMDWVLGSHALLCRFRDPKECLWIDEAVGITPRARLLWRRFHYKLDFKAEVEGSTRVHVLLEGRISKAWMELIPQTPSPKHAPPTRQSSLKAWQQG